MELFFPLCAIGGLAILVGLHYLASKYQIPAAEPGWRTGDSTAATGMGGGGMGGAAGDCGGGGGGGGHC